MDDLGLGPIAPDRLEVAALGLDPGERVERRHERHVEIVLELVPDQPAEPVVAVDHVGPPVRLEPVEDADTEVVGDVAQRFFGQMVRSGLDVHDTVAGFDEDLGRKAGLVGTGEGDALDAGLRQRREELAHVDVHAPAVARARLHQRRRVE